ncbi:hypothetical protein KFE98_18855 [bacterium SCSIO 12741]|nr:hypothetical protein KFE98_18855 [bacterium SCSIO 12741]
MKLKSSLLLVVVLLFAGMAWGQKHDKKKKGSTESESSLTIQDACKKEASCERIKSDITPFKLDKITTTKIHYKAYDQVKEIAVPIFYSTGYKFIINTEGMPTGVTIHITDKPHKMSSAKILHESSSNHFSYELPKDFEGSRIYISVKVPADKEFHNGIRNRGCLILGAGYSNLDF